MGYDDAVSNYLMRVKSDYKKVIRLTLKKLKESALTAGINLMGSKCPGSDRIILLSLFTECHPLRD